MLKWIKKFMFNMKNKKNCLKVKLLHKLRILSRRHIGVFRENGRYLVVWDKDTFAPDVSEYPRNKKSEPKRYQILEENIESLEIAKDRCDYYRRVFILSKVREHRYGTNERYY